MVVIRKSGFGSKNIAKLKSLKTFLQDPLRNEIWHKKLKGWEMKFSKDVDRTFRARTEHGLYRDRLLNDALRVKIEKDRIVVWVAPIRRESKIKGVSSGGTVNNLTSILFNGTGASYGGYSWKWDSRTQVGMHPGVSPSPMRNMWKNYKFYISEQVAKTMKQLTRKKFKEVT